METVRLQDVLADLNLLEAWSTVHDNQGCAGVDGETIEEFSRGLMAQLTALRDEVRSGTYRPRPLLRVEIDKPDGGKRPLSIPAVRDRVLQTAVARVLTPLFEAEFEDCSFAYRKGRSVEQAVRRVEQLRDEGFGWVVDADIREFFDRIDHDLLMQEVETLVADEELLGLIRLWLKTDVVDGERRFPLKQGVPQGSPLSPLLSNLYLDRLDEALLDRNLRLVRFADDFLVLCKDRSRAADALEVTAEVLESLRLEINEQETRIVDFNRGFRFLGVQFVRSLALKTKYPEVDPLAIPRSVPVREERSAGPAPSSLAAVESPDSPPAAMAAGGGGYESAGAEMEWFEEAEFAADEAVLPAGHDPRLRTLYLLEHGYVLGKESERFVVRRRGETVREIPAIKVDQIMVFGNSQITTQAMQFCLKEKIPIFLMSHLGRFYGTIDSFDTDPVLLHREQFLRSADPDFCLNLAREFVRGKICNSRVLLMRQSRKREAPALRQAADDIKAVERRLDQAQTLEQLRGYEGAAARFYFDALAQTLDPAWAFHGRERQPPRDPVNALLSYGYTILFYNVYSFLRSRGLNPHVGYLHPLRAGHAALASDLIEEFRALVVDAVVFKLILNNRLAPDDFDWPQSGPEPCRLQKPALSVFITSLETKLNAPLRHPVSGLRLDYRRCIEHQVWHLAAVIRRRESAYRPITLR